jgi:hypothetical protein
MRLHVTVLVLASFLVATTSRAQGVASEPPADTLPAAVSGPFEPPHNEVALGLGLVGISSSYARRVEPRTAVGFGGGLGGDWVNFSAGTSDHIGTDAIFELLHAELFVRHRTAGSLVFETGGRGSFYLHMTSTAGSGVFIGGYTTVKYSWRWFEFGPRIMYGLFTCGPEEFAINIAPLSLRYVFVF